MRILRELDRMINDLERGNYKQFDYKIIVHPDLKKEFVQEFKNSVIGSDVDENKPMSYRGINIETDHTISKERIYLMPNTQKCES